MDPKKAKELYETIEAFSGYGFNKSHAVAYAVDSYYSAWLHTHYEKHWLATCLQTWNGSPKFGKIISEIKSLGYKILQADINLATQAPRLLEVLQVGDILVISACVSGTNDCANIVQWWDDPNNIELIYNPGIPETRVGKILINEIHHSPAGSETSYEFFELYNNSDENINISGWYFDCSGDGTGSTSFLDYYDIDTNLPEIPVPRKGLCKYSAATKWIIPGGTDKGIHCISISLSIPSALGTYCANILF